MNLVVIMGKVKFIIYDDREGSLTQGRFFEITLSPEDNYQRLTVAPGLWMAFTGVDNQVSMLMDIIPEPHDDSEGDKLPLKTFSYHF